MVGLGQGSESSANNTTFGTYVEGSMSDNRTVLGSLVLTQSKEDNTMYYKVFFTLWYWSLRCLCYSSAQPLYTQVFMKFYRSNLHGVQFKSKGMMSRCANISNCQSNKGLQDFKVYMLSLWRKYYIYSIMCGFFNGHKYCLFRIVYFMTFLIIIY